MSIPTVETPAFDQTDSASSRPRPAGDLLPTWAEIRSAVSDTRLLLKLRWRFVRSTRAKALIWLGLGLFLTAIFIASQVGALIRHYAEQGVGTAAGQFAVNYVIALNRGELGAIGASAVGSVIIVALFTPFTGSSMQPLAPAEDLAGLRPTRIHRYFDSIITNAASAIGFLQLVTLTGIGSLLTLDGGRAGGLLFVWAIWPTLVLLSVCTGWTIELIARKYGRRARRIIGTSLITLIAVAVALDAHHGKTLFGVGDHIAKTLQAAANGNMTVVIYSLAVVAAIATALFITGLIMCRAALARPAPAAVQRAQQGRRIPMSQRPSIALAQLLLSQIVRSPEVRRPLLTICFIGLPAVWFVGNNNVMSTLVVAVPLAVALAFGINMFGILGPSMTWLASQPNLVRKLLPYTVAIQISITLLLAALVWAPAAIAGRVPFNHIASVAAGTLVSTLFTTRSTAHKSVNRPFLVRLGTRGDTIVPPLTAINYTLRFALWSGQIGVLVMAEHGWHQLALVALAIAWTSVRFLQLFRQWADRDVQSFVIKQVAAA